MIRLANISNAYRGCQLTEVYAKAVRLMLSFDKESLEGSGVDLESPSTVTSITTEIDNYKTQDIETFYIGDVIQSISEFTE